MLKKNLYFKICIDGLMTSWCISGRVFRTKEIEEFSNWNSIYSNYLEPIQVAHIIIEESSQWKFSVLKLVPLPGFACFFPALVSPWPLLVFEEQTFRGLLFSVPQSRTSFVRCPVNLPSCVVFRLCYLCCFGPFSCAFLFVYCSWPSCTIFFLVMKL